MLVVSLVAAVGLILYPYAAKEKAVQPSTPSSDRRTSANDQFAKLTKSLAEATTREDHAAIAEISAEIAHASSQRSAGNVNAHISMKRLLLRLGAAQRVTLAMELFDVGTDGLAFLDVVAKNQRSECGDDLNALGMALLAVFAISLLLQAGRWLYLRREYSRPQNHKVRNLRLAVFAVAIGVLEDAPQTVLQLMVASSCGALGWAQLISIVVAITTIVWKLATPLLIKYDLL